MIIMIILARYIFYICAFYIDLQTQIYENVFFFWSSYAKSQHSYLDIGWPDTCQMYGKPTGYNYPTILCAIILKTMAFPNS